MTRANVYAGPAGYWLIRDPSGISQETGLLSGTLPSPAPVAGEDLATTNFPAALGGSREKYREIPIVIQGRSFNADGTQRIEDTGPLTKKRMETVDDETSNRAIEFIREQQAAGKPWFVWWSA